MRGVTPGGEVVSLTAGQEEIVRFARDWACGGGREVVLPRTGRQGGRSVILATIARYDALGWPDDLPA